MPTHHTEERPTCKMTPDQLLGLQRHARAKTVTLTPEITIEDPDAVPTVIASGTQESVPVEITESCYIAPIAAAEPTTFVYPRPSQLGAIVGFAIFTAWTVTEVLVIALS
ncbi:MAG: hypothetical protein ABI678_07105 [Kofleriaceae bacterium]